MALTEATRELLWEGAPPPGLSCDSVLNLRPPSPLAAGWQEWLALGSDRWSQPAPISMASFSTMESDHIYGRLDCLLMKRPGKTICQCQRQGVGTLHQEALSTCPSFRKLNYDRIYSKLPKG